MATGIILAGGASRRMPGDKAFMEVGGRRVLNIQLEVIAGLFDEVLIVSNSRRVKRLSEFESASPLVRVVEEPVAGKGPLGGILSGLMLSSSDENFVLACDMPFIRAEAISFVLAGLSGFDACLPRTPKGLEPLHAAYRQTCRPAIESQIETGNLRVTGFLEKVSVDYVPWERLLQFDPSGRLLTNINEPEDMRRAASGEGSGRL